MVETVTPKPADKCVLLSLTKAKEAFRNYFRSDASSHFWKCQEVSLKNESIVKVIFCEFLQLLTSLLISHDEY